MGWDRCQIFGGTDVLYVLSDKVITTNHWSVKIKIPVISAMEIIEARL